VGRRASVFGKKLPRTAALGRNKVGFSDACRGGIRKQDLSAVRRQTEQSWLHRRGTQLHSIAAVPIGLPQDTVRVRDIGHAVAVFGEGDKLGRNPRKKWLKLIGIRIEAD